MSNIKQNMLIIFCMLFVMCGESLIDLLFKALA
jgi:hypothetical protein